MEVFVGVIIPVKCALNQIQARKKFYQKMSLKEFERILDMIVPKYGTPIKFGRKWRAYHGKRFI